MVTLDSNSIAFGIIITYLFLFTFIAIIQLLIYRKDKRYNKVESDREFIIDQYTTNFYREELDKIIQYRTIYYMSAKTGQTFSMNKSVKFTISNDEIYESLENIYKDVNAHISKKMREYLIYVMGEAWLKSYIHTTILVMVLDYAGVAIKDSTKIDEKKKS